MPHRCEFYIYKRKKKKGSYWYVCYLDPETGKQGTAKSIDVLKERLGLMDFKSVTRRDEAVIIAKQALDKGLIFTLNISLNYGEYCLEFWNYDSSSYIALRNHLKPDSIGKEYANNMVYSLKKHIIPILPTDLKLQQVTTRHLDYIIRCLYEKGLSSGSIQVISYSFLLPLKEAERTGLISSNPAKRIMRIVRCEKQRGCLTAIEMEALCKGLSEYKEKMFPSYYLAILLGITTGMRSGEIRALHLNDLETSQLEGWTKIRISHSIAPYSGLKETKGKYERAVLIPNTLAEELKSNANKKGICLPSKQKCGYISAPTLRNEFYTLLDRIGIDNSIREKRNITFHSLRHTFSTLGRDKQISQEDRMVVLGHKSTEINDRYTHQSDEALVHVSTLTNSLYSSILSAEKSTDLLESSISNNKTI